MFVRVVTAVLIAGVLCEQTHGAKSAATRPVRELIPFYEKMSAWDRRVLSGAWELLWKATGTGRWADTEKRLWSIAASRLEAGPWDGQAAAGLAYCGLFAAYIPKLEGQNLSGAERRDFQRWLLDHPELARRFIFALSGADQVGAAVGVLYELYRRAPETVLRYPDLSVAMAIVLDGGTGIDGQHKDTFVWLTSPKVALAWDIRSLPHELARYLLDVRVSREERQWAYSRYRSLRNLNQAYGDVKYDGDSLKGKRPKRISGHDYTLMNLQAYGGVCVDQAYFAGQVGRIMGFPVATISHGGEGMIGHCWCLQLTAASRAFRWREVGGGGYGWVTDPATGQRGSDQTLGFVLESLRRAPRNREIAAALGQLAMRIPDWVRRDIRTGPDVLAQVSGTQPLPQGGERASDYYQAERDLEPVWVIRESLQADPYNPTGWAAVEHLGKSEDIAIEELIGFLDDLSKATGTRFPDVLFSTVTALQPRLPANDEKRFLETVLKRLTPEMSKQAPDMAGESLMRLGQLVQAEGNADEALDYYGRAMTVDPDYPPNAVRGLKLALPLAKQMGKLDRIDAFCRGFFQRTANPVFGMEVARVLCEGEMPEKAIRWLQYVYEKTPGETPGRYDAARMAIDLLVQMGEEARAAYACRRLYETTMHPQDGQRLVQLLENLGRNREAQQAKEVVERNELRRQQDLNRDAARRAELQH